MLASYILRIKLSIFILVYATTIIGFCQAQEGNYYLTDHTPHLKQVDAVNFDIVQAKDHIVYVANRTGVLRYEGLEWELIPTSSAAFSLAIDGSNHVYVGCLTGFGKLAYDSLNELTYKELSGQLQGVKNIFAVEIAQGKSHFLSEDKLYVVDNDTEEIVVIRTPKGTHFLNFLIFEGELLVSIDDGNLYGINTDKLERTSGVLKDIDNIYFSTKNPTNEEYILGTSDNRLFIVFNGNFREIENDKSLQEQYLDIIDASWISNDLLAIGTIHHGCVFINPRTGEVINRVDYFAGLPDNEIFAMYADHDDGLWISHEAGITRVSPTIPLRSFNNYSGLEGHLLTAQEFDMKLFVGTSLGVFYLDQVKEYEEIVDYVKIVSGVASESKSPSRKKGLFRNWGKRKKEAQSISLEKPNVVYKRRVKKELLSSYYKYHKVAGINSKVEQLIPQGNSLLVASKDGIYEITDGKAELIQGFPSKYLYLSSNDELMLVSTQFGEVRVFKKPISSWEPLLVLNDFDENIQHITEDNDGTFWLSGTENVYKVFIDGSNADMSVYPIENLHYDKVVSLTMQGKQFFVNSSGLISYDPIKDQLLKSEVNILSNADKFMYSYPNHLWFFKDGLWSRVSYSSKLETKLDYLNLFDGVRHIFDDDENGLLWIITDDSKLYRYDFIQNHQPPVSPLLLKSVTNYKTGETISRKELEVNRDQSSLTFSIVQPDFLEASKVQYQYMVAGLEDDWSEWGTQHNNISYRLIPSGEYQLMVKSRNIFGQEQILKPYEFKVLPPFWDQPWFYALEVLFFGGLLLLSIHFNRREHKLTWVSRLLTYITLIFIIEFLQTIGENKFGDENPVLNFFITAFIAMCIFPLEGILRKFIIKEHEGVEPVSE